MGRILLLLVGVAILALPAAAAAGAQTTPGFLVVRNASTDGGVTGRPVATIVVRGFVLGHIAQEGAVQLYNLAAGAGSNAAPVTGVAISRRRVSCCHGAPGTEYRGSDFRFRAVGGVWRVVVYGAGVSLYAAGTSGKRGVKLHGSVAYPRTDGHYSFNGGRFASMPAGVVTRGMGAK